MLVTNVGGLAEIVPHKQAGYVVEPKANEISDAIIHYFEEDKLSDFEKQVKEEKKKYDWSTMTAEINKLFKLNN